MKDNSRRCLLLLAIALLLTGCARTATTAYYQLTAAPPERQEAVAPRPTAAVIGIGPITLPEYLDRPQIVSRQATNRLQISDRHRWAEPLADNIAQVLQENLARTLGSENVILYPWSPSLSVDLHIPIEILHCEADDGDVWFVARWSVQSRESKVLLSQQRSSHRLNVAPPSDYDRRAAALSEALARFSAEIAAAVGEHDKDQRGE